MSKIRKKNGRFSPFFVIVVSVETAEYSAEYSVFGRTLVGTVGT